MAKKKKQEKEEIEYIEPEDLDNYDEDDYVLETKWQVFKRNYKNVASFRAFVKLMLYLFLLIFLVVAVNINNSGKKNKDEKTTEPTTDVTIKFQDLLDELLKNKQYKCEIEINGKSYILNGLYGNNILTGSLFTDEGTYSYKLKDNKIYEVKLKNEVENKDLLKDINIKIIDNTSLVNIIKNSSGIKVENGYKYNKVTIDDVLYNVEISLLNNHIKNINITSDNISYKFTYDEVFLID